MAQPNVYATHGAQIDDTIWYTQTITEVQIMKQWDVVMVHWVDSSGTGRWTDTEAVLEDEHVARCWTAGFYLGHSDACIKIASSSSDNDQVDHIMYIPKVAIIKTVVLAKGAK